MCVGVKGLVCQRWAESNWCNPFNKTNKNGCMQQDWLILNMQPMFGAACSDRILFSAADQGDATFPWRMRRKRAWLGFIFMTSHFFAGKHSAQKANTLQSARASIAAPARSQACIQKENSWDLTHLSSFKLFRQPRLTKQLGKLLRNWAYSWFHFCVFPGVLLSFCACIIIFLNRRLMRSELLRCFGKGKGASPSVSKALVRPKHNPYIYCLKQFVCIFYSLV